MRQLRVVLTTGVLVIAALTGCAPVSDFALINQRAGDTGAVCGARSTVGGPHPFTYYVTVRNDGTSGSIQVKYADGDVVEYPIPAAAAFHFSQAGGGTLNVNDLIQVRSVGGAVLTGSMSLYTFGQPSPHPALAPSYCKTCPFGPCP